MKKFLVAAILSMFSMATLHAAPEYKGKKEIAVATTSLPQSKLKKDGTPDKRYKQNKKLKKDGTPDKRFKENKKKTGK
jgi:hypothetical protein